MDEKCDKKRAILQVAGNSDATDGGQNNVKKWPAGGKGKSMKSTELLLQRRADREIGPVRSSVFSLDEFGGLRLAERF